MCGEQGCIALRETVHLVKFIGKGCSIFFRVLMLRYLVLQDIRVLKYSSRIHMVYLAAQQQNKLYNVWPIPIICLFLFDNTIP